MKFLTTTRRERLEEMKANGFHLIGVDGTVPNSLDLYDELYDHHREGGGMTQIEDMEGTEYPEISDWSKVCFVTTMIDADAICASVYRHTHRIIENYDYDMLLAISYDCDHLVCPLKYETQYFKREDASMVVAALKELSNSLVEELHLPSDRKEWTLDQKEEFSSEAFSLGFDCIIELMNAEVNVKDTVSMDFNYREIAKPYWDKVKAQTERIVKEDLIEIYEECAIFKASSFAGEYVDPRAWINALEHYTSPDEAVTLTQRSIFIDNKFKGYSYTLGSIPLHPKQQELDYTKGVYQALSILDGNKNPWGGRKTVGGSGWNEVSNLTPEQAIDVVLQHI